MYVCLENIYEFISLLFVLLVSYISRVPQSLEPQGIARLKVETNSGIGGNIFMLRWKDFQGREERKSWLGGKIFTVRRKLFRGKVERKSGQKSKGGTIFMVEILGIF